MEKIVRKLILKNKTISTMESCTGGSLVNSITNVEGASSVLKFSAVTYSNEYKIKFGVKERTIKKYSVYSIQVAKEMSKCISDFTNSDFGIGITGKFNKPDIDNPTDNDAIVYVSIYDKDKDTYTTLSIDIPFQNRILNKELVVKNITKILEKIV